MPEWIFPDELLDYFKYNDQKVYYNNLSIKLRKLLQISYFFQNTSLVSMIIYKEIIPNLNNENSINFLEDAHSKLSVYTEEVDQVWFDLFVASLNYVSLNFLFFLTNKFESLISINKLLIEEIVEKYIYK